jgi:hypothetical protein
LGGGPPPIAGVLGWGLSRWAKNFWPPALHGPTRRCAPTPPDKDNIAGVGADLRVCPYSRQVKARSADIFVAVCVSARLRLHIIRSGVAATPTADEADR